MRGSGMAGALAGLLFLVVILAAVLPGAPALPAVPPAVTGVGAALWGARGMEVLLQGFILLAGSAAVLLYLGTRAPKEGSP
jgi:Na+/H+ antiporter NhaD/arsenite permease-like protein